jgi:hypothetical protein
VSQRRVVALAAAMGIAIPAIWLVLYWAFLRGNPTLISSVMSATYLDRVLVAIWPSWIFLIADPEEQSIAIPALSIAVNALLYSILGWAVWFGLNRKRAVLGFAAAVVLVGWYFLLRWYVGG